jgi:hypothetical protein
MIMENISTKERPGEPSAHGAQGTFEDFLMHLAIAFVNILPENIDREINRALAMTGMFTCVDRAEWHGIKQFSCIVSGGKPRRIRGAGR